MQLFHQMVYNSFFCAVLIVLTWAADKVLRKWYQKTWRYYLWMLIAVRMLIPFDVSLENAPIQLRVDNVWQDPAAKSAEDPVSDLMLHGTGKAARGESSEGKVIPDTAQGTAEDGEMTGMRFAARIWLLGCMGILLYFFSSYAIQRGRIHRYSLPVVEQDIQQLWKKMMTEEKISESIPIYRCGLIHAPMIGGIGKKELLLPEREYTSLELAYIFRHEIQHLKYHDLYLKLMYLLLCAVYWFQPAVWLMKREFARDLEAVCDRRTIRGFSASERYSYTQTMIQCMTQKKELRFPVSSGFGGTVKIMKERVRLIMKGNKMRKGFGIYAALAVLMCTGMLLVSCGSKAGKESQESSKELPALNENVSADTKQTEPIGIKEQDAPVKNTEEISEREATGSMQEENLNISADSENAAVEVPEQINLQNEEAQQIAEAEVPFASQSTAEENVEIASGSRNEETEIPLAEATDDSSAELPEQKNK